MKLEGYCLKIDHFDTFTIDPCLVNTYPTFQHSAMPYSLFNSLLLNGLRCPEFVINLIFTFNNTIFIIVCNMTVSCVVPKKPSPALLLCSLPTRQLISLVRLAAVLSVRPIPLKIQVTRSCMNVVINKAGHKQPLCVLLKSNHV